MCRKLVLIQKPFWDKYEKTSSFITQLTLMIFLFNKTLTQNKKVYFSNFILRLISVQ